MDGAAYAAAHSSAPCSVRRERALQPRTFCSIAVRTLGAGGQPRRQMHGRGVLTRLIGEPVRPTPVAPLGKAQLVWER